MKSQKLNDYQYEELQKGVLLINKYDLSLKYLYELNANWKEFFFDLMDKLSEKKGFFVKPAEEGESLLDYFKRDYEYLIKEYNIKIDFRDYIELNDYMTFKEWIAEDGNFMAFKDWDLYLLSDKTDLFE
jgi:hypothetical protein